MWPDTRRVRATLAQARVTAAAVIETLEQRQLLSVTLTDSSAPTALLDGDGALQGTARIEHGILRVVATARNDEIQVGSTPQTGGIYFWVNGAGAQVDASLVRGIQIDAGDGDDMVYYNNLGGLLNLPTTINGGGGDDDLTGEDDRDCSDYAIAFRDQQASYAKVVLDGGDGNDRLMARIGDTTLVGGGGDDQIFAQASYDTWGHNTVIDDGPPAVRPGKPRVVSPVPSPQKVTATSASRADARTDPPAAASRARPVTPSCAPPLTAATNGPVVLDNVSADTPWDVLE
jgi:Ca2+-binding RTX toxin-like protein